MTKKKKPKLKMDFKHGVICGKCAKARGAKWPKGHCATAWTGICPYCNAETTVIPDNDFIWPGQKGLSVWD